MRNRHLVLLVAGLFTLAGCGAGSGGGNTRPDPARQALPVQLPPPPVQSGSKPEPEPPPPIPAGLDVSCGIGVCLVSWDNPFSTYDNHGQARIYRNTVNRFSTATEVGQASWIMFTDHNLRDNTSYYYWVVFESDDGERGPVSSVASDQTALNPESVYEDIVRDLEDSPLLELLQPDDDDTDSDPDSGPLEGPASLQCVGTARQTGTSTYSVANVWGRFPGIFAGTRPAYSFNNWGLWAKVGNATLFRADIRPDTFGLARHVEGSQSGSNPVSGSAVWTGDVRAYDAHPDTFGTPITGAARLEVDFRAATVDVDFTSLSGGHADLSWDGLRIRNGRFRDTSGAYKEIRGAFYGAEHQGVAGTFRSDRLDGVFGATR